MDMVKFFRNMLKTVVVTSLAGCGGSPSISVLPSTDSFQQEGNEITAKMDILWVIDNSGSMQQEQQDLRDNFNSFITSFVGKGYDYRMAVVTTDAYYTKNGNITVANGFDVGAPGLEQTAPHTNFVFNSFNANIKCPGGSVVTSSFVDGDLTAATQSGYVLIDSADATIDFSVFDPADPKYDPADPAYIPNNVKNIFAVNSNVGLTGCHAESGLESAVESLADPANTGFPRPDAHLAVILVSDEEDQIPNGSGGVVINPTAVADYHATLTAAASTTYGYSFHTIARLTDDACGQTYTAGHRYQELSDLSGGVKASICGDFATALDDIAQTIIEKTVEFSLTDTPADPNKLQVSVKNSGETEFTVVPQDVDNGWTYNATANSIVFHGSAIPGQGAEISILYDPDGL